MSDPTDADVAATERAPDAGAWIVRAAWSSVALYAVVAVPFALGVDALEGAAVAVSLGLFLVSLPVWIYAFLRAVGRTAAGDEIQVASLFFLAGSAPRRVRAHLLGATVVCIAIVAATAASNPFGVLVPMLPLGGAGLWGSIHGVFPPRPSRGGQRGGRR
ncbi:MAG TPA: hypothetical protein VFZ83_05745 [Acidimicrobiia bacterium]|nr:hypothetical protein [Acidimicrobiia bacterium]